MAIPLTRFQEPGFFSQIQEVSSLFLLPGAVQVVALIGSGKVSKSVLSESATRVDSGGNFETLANAIQSITRVYSLSVFQYPISSYSTSITGTVVEGLGYNVSGKTFKLAVNDEAVQTVTFTGVDPLSLATVVAQLNAPVTGLVGVKAAAVASKLQIISSLTGDGGKKIKISNGTSNADFGFTADAVASDLNWTASIASTNPNVRPLDGEDYLVDYETPKVAADFAPKFFFSQAGMLAEYGDATPTNSLSLGGNAVFGNGAAITVARQLDPAATTTMQIETEARAALADLELVDCDIVVSMLTDTVLWGDYLTHVSKMSSQLERRERIAILGLDETAGRIDTLGVSPSYEAYMAALVPNSGLQPRRLIVMNPGSALTTVKGVQYNVTGAYLAACLAGRLVSPEFDTATPMTNKTLATVDELITPDLSRAEKNTLTSLGVTVLEVKSGLVKIRRAVTADTTSIAAQEPSIVRAFDQVARQMREALENRFIGTKITNTTKGEVASAVNTFLLRFVGDQIISAFRNIDVQVNSVEPRQLDISFEALPIFPFLWGSLNITITLS